MRKNTKRSAEFKLKLVKEKLKGNSFTGLSKKWDVPVSQLMKWVDQYSSLGTTGLLPRSRPSDSASRYAGAYPPLSFPFHKTLLRLIPQRKQVL